jgi:hypothetical protein
MSNPIIDRYSQLTQAEKDAILDAIRNCAAGRLSDDPNATTSENVIMNQEPNASVNADFASGGDAIQVYVNF